jgi:hypothetical protein
MHELLKVLSFDKLVKDNILKHELFENLEALIFKAVKFLYRKQQLKGNKKFR